jgi:hypothetical protein
MKLSRRSTRPEKVRQPAPWLMMQARNFDQWQIANSHLYLAAVRN